MFIYILSSIIVLLVIAFFSGIEIAFLSANKLRIELDKNKGSTSGKILSEFNEHRHEFVSTLLVGLNICVIIFGSIMANFLVPENFTLLPHNRILLLIIQTVITTAFVLFLGEFFPKALFRINPDKTLSFFAIPLKIIHTILYPFTWVLVKTSKIFMKIFLGKELESHKEEFSAIDLEYLIKEASNGSDDIEAKEEDNEIDAEIFEKALYLKDVKVRECMVHRMKVEAVNSNCTVDELKEKFIETQHSRILVYENSIDNIVGYIYHQDLFKNPTEIKPLIRKTVTVAETSTARDLLYTFIKDRKNMSIVIDEYGGTAGIVTLEDLIEEIFGEIEDEHDVDDQTDTALQNGTYMFSGDMEIDLINEKYHLDIPSSESYETLNGYILYEHESIPEQNEELSIGDYLYTIIEAADNKIIKVFVKPIHQENL
ncbi:MAG: hemolysin family protein [Bacteroidota bacterium]